MVAIGAVSVMPQDEVIGMRSPVARDRDRLEPLPQVLGQRGAGIEDEAQPGEEHARERRLALEEAAAAWRSRPAR